ncbi:MAG TPA: DMT family transporter [Devosia sp.]|nr:DMT family transporter [Devosia sp.]
MPAGVLLALLSYSLYAIGDAITKTFTGSAMSVFEISFVLNIFSLVALPFARQPGERWGDIVKLRHPVLMNVRALLYTAASLCFTFAVTRIPFAETYSLAFLAPLFLTFLSFVILREKVVPLRWVLIVASFIGVLIVVRPGFRDIGLGHVAAISCAILAAGANIALRLISNSERQTSIIAFNGAYQLLACGALMLSSFVMLSWDEVFRLAVIGLIGGAAQILVIRAMQRAPASHIGPTQYVQILWAVALGAIFFRETPDAIGYAGLVLLVIAGVGTIFSDGAQARISGRWAEFRARRGEPEINRVEGPEI